MIEGPHQFNGEKTRNERRVSPEMEVRNIAQREKKELKELLKKIGVIDEILVVDMVCRKLVEAKAAFQNKVASLRSDVDNQVRSAPEKSFEEIAYFQKVFRQDFDKFKGCVELACSSILKFHSCIKAWGDFDQLTRRPQKVGRRIICMSIDDQTFYSNFIMKVSQELGYDRAGNHSEYYNFLVTILEDLDQLVIEVDRLGDITAEEFGKRVV